MERSWAADVEGSSDQGERGSEQWGAVVFVFGDGETARRQSCSKRCQSQPTSTSRYGADREPGLWIRWWPSSVKPSVFLARETICLAMSPGLTLSGQIAVATWLRVDGPLRARNATISSALAASLPFQMTPSMRGGPSRSTSSTVRRRMM